MRTKCLVLLLCLALCLVGASALADQDFQFAENRYDVFEGQTVQLELLRQGEAAAAPDLTFTSSNQKQATVDANGLVTGRAKGSVTITAAVTVGNRKVTARTTVNVLRPVTEIDIDESKLNLTAPDDVYLEGLLQVESDLPVLILPVGKATALTVTLLPKDASNRNVIVTAEDETLFKQLKPTGIHPADVGETILTVASASNPEICRQYHAFLVQPAKKVTVKTDKADVVVGGTVQAWTEFTPTDATWQKVTWSTSTPKILAVNEFGTVTGLSMGTGRIRATATDGSGQYGEISIRVAQQPTGVTIKGATTVRTGATTSLQATVSPSNANVKTVTWSSSDESVATVSANGSVKGLKAGFCVITATSTVDSAIFASVPMTVEQRVTGITAGEKSLTLNTGESGVITWTVAPADATNPSVTLTSGNTKVATVDETGLVHAVAKGTATITIKAGDGSGKTATVSVTVNQPPTGVTIEGKNSVVVGRTINLKGVITPSNANVKTVTWSSSDPTVATVSANGTVKGVKAGICVITCTSTVDPAIFNSVPMEVVQLVTRIDITTPALTIKVGETGRLAWTVSPEDATNKNVTLSSSNKGVATVDQDGTVHALKRGSVNITVKASDGSNRSGTLKVNVIQPVYGVHMKNDTVTVGVGETVVAQAILEPSDASNRNMTWTIDDPTLAGVNGTNTNPRLSGRAWGTTTLTGITEDGGFVARCTVKVGRNEQALRIRKVNVENNRIRLTVFNESNMNINRFYYTIECYDIYDNPLPVTSDGRGSFTGYYLETLYPGETTIHGRFHFDDFIQPGVEIGRVVFILTGYRCDDGFSYQYKFEQRPTEEYMSPNWIQPVYEENPGEDPPIGG